MGYTTSFYKNFSVTPTLTPVDRTFLTKFAETRRMKRKLGPEFGVDGEFFVDGKGDFGQDDDDSVVDHNRPPATQPGLWCQWIPNQDGTEIGWDGNEKFNNYVEWLEYLIKSILKPRGYTLNGQVEWQGESGGDMGRIEVKDNVIKVKTAAISYE